MRTKISLAVLLVFILGAVYIVLSTDKDDYKAPSKSTDTKVTATTTTQGLVASYAMSDIAMHADKKSCWSVVNGSVYDLTTWIGEHPGGAGAILGICGKDGTAAFSKQHGDDKRPANELTKHFIGVLNR